ncbi:MAG: O-antigen ligase family protein [Gemmatimonadota bacterium]|jgi:O-antigen ligase|nr:O-antigen ligase family protein [Gemmatimonadota bacterium]MDP7030741.1 O-antigen ligase family protein [Gemmatimonadota bacterium]
MTGERMLSGAAGRGVIAATLMAALATSVAFFPAKTAFLVLTLAMSGALIWKVGLRRGAWLLALITIPLRQPLGSDVLGTITLYYGDVLLFTLLGATLWREGLSGFLRSTTLRIGLAILAISTAGLYGAPQPIHGLETVHRMAAQLAVFVIAKSEIRTAGDARQSLLAFLGGLSVAMTYGLYQASLPVTPGAYVGWATAHAAYDAGTGDMKLRIFSTYDHALHFSHALSVGFGLALGLLSGRQGVWGRVFLGAVVVAAATCNQHTYSVGGAVAVGSTVAVWSVLGSRRRLLVILPALVLVWTVSAPDALYRRLDQVFSGKSTSAMARIITYHQVAEVVRDHPVRGVGWGGISRSLDQDYRTSHARSVALTAENLFLQRALAMGVPGLALMVALFVLFARNVAKGRPPPGRSRPEEWPRAALILGGTAFLVQGMVIPVGDESSNYLLWFLLAMAERMHEATTTSGGA